MEHIAEQPKDRFQTLETRSYRQVLQLGPKDKLLFVRRDRFVAPGLPFRDGSLDLLLQLRRDIALRLHRAPYGNPEERLVVVMEFVHDSGGVGVLPHVFEKTDRHERQCASSVLRRRFHGRRAVWSQADCKVEPVEDEVRLPVGLLVPHDVRVADVTVQHERIVAQSMQRCSPTMSAYITV